MKNNSKKINSTKHVLFGSLIGTTIEFFDFYIYANAAVLVFPQLFFPSSDSTMATLESLATFSIAFLSASEILLPCSFKLCSVLAKAVWKFNCPGKLDPSANQTVKLFESNSFPILITSLLCSTAYALESSFTAFKEPNL